MPGKGLESSNKAQAHLVAQAQVQVQVQVDHYSSVISKLCLSETITLSPAQKVEVDTKDISVARMGQSTASRLVILTLI